MTLLLILVILITVIVLYTRHKQEQIVGLTKEQILKKHQHAFTIYRGWLVFTVILFVGGYLLAKCYPMYKTEEYEYWWFGTQKGTREVFTTSAWWSYILRGLGVLIGMPVLIGFLDRWGAVRKYKKMTQDEYFHLQQSKHSVNHVFSSPTSIINFTSKKPSYDDTRRSSRNNELLQRAQSDL